MSTLAKSSLQTPALGPLELHNGDRMTREEFHRRYEQTPEHFKAELIGGIVYVASPLRLPHARSDPLLATLLATYMGNTPGTEACTNATVQLAPDSEPQPDVLLRVLPEHGGQSRTTPNQYIEGAPELIAEVAHSSRSIDLGAKREDYARHGVKEYFVLSLDDRKLFWFDLAAGIERSADPDGIMRSRIFPGLWIDHEALLARDFRKLIAALDRGLATPEHAGFVQTLAGRRG